MKGFLRTAFVLFVLTFAQQAWAGYELIWRDEFNYQGLPDPAKWGYDDFEPKALNNELQKYTSFRLENTRVEGGVLTIEARHDWYSGYEYTSGRLTTRNKFSFNQGLVEIRAKLPWGRGTWPGMFLLPQNEIYGSWPKSGEIDIMEHVGYNMDWVRASIHCEEYNFKKKWVDHTGEERNGDAYVNGVANDFHIYKLEWTNDQIAVSVDGKTPYFVYRNEQRGPISWPFNHNFYLILNQAVGGDWGGIQGIDTGIYPQSMQVDYVRVYQWR